MDKKEKEQLEKKMNLYKKLGAVKFQKIVLKLEKIKFRFIKKYIPNSVKYYDKYIDFKTRRLLRKTKTIEEKKIITKKNKIAKMSIRKELNTEKNRNYHIDNNKPTEIINLLKWNKKVHEQGLIKDAILIPVFITGTALNIPGALPLLIFELVSAGINFECINIQNYNICRFKIIEPYLKRREERKIKREMEDYGEAIEVIHKTVDKSESLPTIDEIVDGITNVEQLKQMKALLQVKLEERQKENNNKNPVKTLQK